MTNSGSELPLTLFSLWCVLPRRSVSQLSQSQPVGTTSRYKPREEKKKKSSFKHVPAEILETPAMQLQKSCSFVSDFFLKKRWL